MSRASQLGPGVWARLRYRVFDAEGEALEPAPVETGLVFGYGALLPALEAALAGKTAGARVVLELRPRQAFGERDPALVAEVAREEFPPGVAPGDSYEFEREDGTTVVLSVLDVTESGVVLDLNHPLAGQRVRFEVEVLEARPASADELSLAEARLGEDPSGPPESSEGDLIPPARLLRPGSKR